MQQRCTSIRRTASAGTASATPPGSRETSGRGSAPATVGVVWVRMNARAVRDGDEEYWEDITGQQRAEDAERRSDTPRAGAALANAAAHEINNPLSVITGRLELIRQHLDPAQHARLDQALEASKRIADIIAHMGHITRMETHADSAVSPMLDLRRSSAPPEQP